MGILVFGHAVAPRRFLPFPMSWYDTDQIWLRHDIIGQPKSNFPLPTFNLWRGCGTRFVVSYISVSRPYGAPGSNLVSIN